MKVERIFKQVIALAFCVGAIPFLLCAHAYAQETNDSVVAVKQQNPWLDDYHKPVGFTYGAEAKIQAAYLYRGRYCGGPNIQGEASVGYGGLYGVMWWNIGVETWEFKTFQPEVDFIIGFARWGLDISMLYVHNFDHRFFDMTNYLSGGNSIELRARYTVSSKLPLSILWATRVAGADGYLNPVTGDTVRAWSSYLEISYTHRFPYEISLYGGIGITPWRSRFTRFKSDFAVPVLELKLRKNWDVGNRCGLMLQGTLLINPSALAADPTSYQWHPYDPSSQSINTNIAFGVYLR